MKHSHAAATSLAFLIAATASQAETIIYFDDFTDADSTTILGLAPDTNNGVAGATFHESNNFWTENSNVGIYSNRAQLGADNQASLAIGSTGGFTQPQFIRVSAIMNLGNTNPNAADSTRRGVGLGFFNATSGIATPDDFRGLVITTDGRLILAQHGANGVGRAGEIAEITTGLSTSADHTLSFEIDTITGDISNILLNGALQSDLATTFFNSGVNHVGFFANSGAGFTLAQFDDFTVTEVPEPGSLALIGLGGLLIARRRRS